MVDLMTRAILLLTVVILFAGCASNYRADLEREFGHFRYEQEKYRREELEKLYEEERRRSDALTEKIIRLREEIQRKEKELSELEKRRDADGG